jgi:hypothetical protein
MNSRNHAAEIKKRAKIAKRRVKPAPQPDDALPMKTSVQIDWLQKAAALGLESISDLVPAIDRLRQLEARLGTAAELSGDSAEAVDLAHELRNRLQSAMLSAYAQRG